MKQLVAGGERNAVTQPIADAVGMPTLRNWNLSVPLHHFHTHIHLPGDGECDVIMCDCTHVCHPSWPQVMCLPLPLFPPFFVILYFLFSFLFLFFEYLHLSFLPTYPLVFAQSRP